MWRGRGAAIDAAPADIEANDDHRLPDERRRSMSWAQRLKRVFGIDVSTCVHCGGAVRIVASIEEPTVIRAILAHFKKHDAMEGAHYRPDRAGHRPWPWPRSRKIGHAPQPRKPTAIRCGSDPAGARLARCRDSVRNGHGRRGCVARRCRNTTHRRPIGPQTGAGAAAA